MASVSASTLNWLHTVLINGYQYQEQAFYQIADALSNHPFLRPRTDVYTSYDDGSALYVCLSGEPPLEAQQSPLPSALVFWFPYSFPAAPPIVHSTHPATPRLFGQNQDGSISSPYLTSWTRQRQNQSLSELIGSLVHVLNRGSSGSTATGTLGNGRATDTSNGSLRPIGGVQPGPSGSQAAAPPPRPSKTPFNAATASFERPAPASGPPPPPPKPYGTTSQLPTRAPSNPRPPPKPSQTNYSNFVQDQSYGQGTTQKPMLPTGFRPDDHPYGAMVSPSHQAYAQAMIVPHALDTSVPNPGNRLTNTVSPMSAMMPSPSWAGPPQPRSRPNPTASRDYGPPATAASVSRREPPRRIQQQLPDLLSEPLPAEAGNATDNQIGDAPPVPLNPAKDELIHRIVEELSKLRGESSNQMQGSLAALRSQQEALKRASVQMSQEAEALQLLDAQLSTNERILRETMAAADGVLEEARRSEVPSTDEALIAPHVIGNQLYDLVSQERAMSDVLFALTRALDSGRIGIDAWAKHTRAIARDQFFKKALIGKIAEGTGLRHGSGSLDG